MSAVERTLVAGGIALTDEGEGRTLLMLHGIGGNARSCGPVGRLLTQDGVRVLAWDAPGYGESADPAGPVDHVASVIQVLDELELDEVDLFGTSWGGVIATVVAARWPARVRTLVLADSTRGSGTRPDGAAAMRARVEALAEEGPERFASLRAPRLVAATCTPDVAEAVRAEMARVRLPGYRAAAEFMAGSDTSSLLPGITTPTLVIVGEHDEVVGVAESELLARTIPGARLHIVRGAGHAALSERPTDVATAVLDFWRAAT